MNSWHRQLLSLRPSWLAVKYSCTEQVGPKTPQIPVICGCVKQKSNTTKWYLSRKQKVKQSEVSVEKYPDVNFGRQTQFFYWSIQGEAKGYTEALSSPNFIQQKMFLIFLCLIAYIFWPSQLRGGKSFHVITAGLAKIRGETSSPRSSCWKIRSQWNSIYRKKNGETIFFGNSDAALNWHTRSTFICELLHLERNN